MKTVGYVRVSTDKHAERGISLEAQVEKIRLWRWCKAPNWWPESSERPAAARENRL